MRNAPDNLKLGYDKHREIDEIRNALLQNGFCGNDWELFFACEREYARRHADDPTYRERQAQWNARQPKSTLRTIFDDEELAYIAERLNGSNSEIGQRILRKIEGPSIARL